MDGQFNYKASVHTVAKAADNTYDYLPIQNKKIVTLLWGFAIKQKRCRSVEDTK